MKFADHTRINAIQFALALNPNADRDVASLIADAEVIHKFINTEPLDNGFGGGALGSAEGTGAALGSVQPFRRT